MESKGYSMEGPRTIDNVSPRDIVILKTRIDHPSATTRELSSILEEQYGISLSHNRVNEILHDLGDKNLFRKTLLPSQDLFLHYLFSIDFYYPAYADSWEDCYDDLIDDPHVVMFFNTDAEYHWQLITQFRSLTYAQRWVHELWLEHGELFRKFHITDLDKIHKFRTDAEIFDDLLRETEEGRQYLQKEPPE